MQTKGEPCGCSFVQRIEHEWRGRLRECEQRLFEHEHELRFSSRNRKTLKMPSYQPCKVFEQHNAWRSAKPYQPFRRKEVKHREAWAVCLVGLIHHSRRRQARKTEGIGKCKKETNIETVRIHNRGDRKRIQHGRKFRLCDARCKTEIVLFGSVDGRTP